ncbi:MAG: hypothetical protein Q8S46_00460 [Methylotenera sp.]|nr:hypothetical protein [Methylotenera sp.]MDP1754921.1 hypothetical protein [Methylotenera sp.]MDP1958809.1 hypothetical protein [Methylotenera sp.]MDP3206702.1 hypothetical protein [Methylotenera sp.]MDP3302614.1 hypothetical protein [Methylotenera sp.]
MMKNHYNKHTFQKGGALIIFVLVLVLAGSATLFSFLNGNNVKFERDKKTLAVLAEAKVALLVYAASVNLSHAGCAANCRRPGDLPCPDTNNDGVAETSCGNATGTTGQDSRLGRLPWKTLGLDDLRDGNGDRLWYAVSNRFKQNARAFPLNSDTLGTLSVMNGSGSVVQDATGSSGAVAVVISAGLPITRQNTIVQSRILANENNATHYLDNALGEDNADFVDAGANGFIKGEIRDASGTTILNDHLIVISRSDMMNAIEPLVAAEVAKAVSVYFVDNAIYPSPASFSDFSCLGMTTIGAGSCLQNVAINSGRIPVNPSPDWDSTSVLIGISNNNWFQQNGWRELIYYAHGALTLMPGAIGKNMIVIATGPVVGSQSRASNTEKGLELNYLELENLTLLDNTYLRLPMIKHGNSFNDFPVSQP